MTLGGFATPFVVPPVNLAVLALLAHLAGWRRLAGVALVALLLLALPAVADGLLVSLEQGEGPGDPAGAQAIVVLGAEQVDLPDGTTLPGLLTLERLRTAAALARRTGLPILVSGGAVRPGAPPIALAMVSSLQSDFDVPARWAEIHSADTFENARDSAAILAKDGVTSVLVVTDAWHMRRAMIAFRAARLHAIPAPVPVPKNEPPDLEDFIPRVNAWMTSYYALHEWIGVAWYALRAGL